MANFDIQNLYNLFVNQYKNNKMNFLNYLIVFIVCIGLFITTANELYDENYFSSYINYIYNIIFKLINTKFFFWLIIIFINIIITISLNTLFQLYFWNTIYQQFPERFIS